MGVKFLEEMEFKVRFFKYIIIMGEWFYVCKIKFIWFLVFDWIIISLMMFFLFFFFVGVLGVLGLLGFLGNFEELMF